MNHNPKLLYTLAVLVLIVAAGSAFLLNKSKATTTAKNQITSSQNPQDVVPGMYKNPITNQSTKPGFTLGLLAVQDNTDAAGKAVNDRLEFAITNTTTSTLSSFEVYYAITDSITNKKEGYYKKLDGLSIAAGATQKVYFDNLSGAGHFSSNTGSIYYTSSNPLVIDLQVSSPGFKLQTAQIKKDASNGEKKD